MQLLDVSRREMGKMCGAAVKTRGSMGKKRYNVQDRVGYSATLDAAGMAALNPRASGNGAHLLDVAFACRIRDWGPLNYTCGLESGELFLTSFSVSALPGRWRCRNPFLFLSL